MRDIAFAIEVLAAIFVIVTSDAFTGLLLGVVFYKFRIFGNQIDMMLELADSVIDGMAANEKKMHELKKYLDDRRCQR